MNTTVTRSSAPARKPNRRPGAVPSRPDTVVQLADRAVARRATRWAAAYRRETARSGRWPARAAT